MPVPTPSTILTAATDFSINLTHELHLTWILREYIQNPLPPNYSRATNDEGEMGYINMLTGEGSTEHPAREYFERVIASERRKFERAREEGDNPTNSVHPETPGKSLGLREGVGEIGVDDWMEFIGKIDNGSIGTGTASTEGNFERYETLSS